MGCVLSDQRYYSINLVKEFEENEVKKDNIVWLNYPSHEDYRFVENPKIKKNVLKKMNGPQRQYLKLSEWNLKCSENKESVIQCILWDKNFYLITITLNIAGNEVKMEVKKIQEDKVRQGVYVAAWFGKGELTISRTHKLLEQLNIFYFKLPNCMSFFLTIENVKSIKEENLFKEVEFRKYILYFRQFVEYVGKECFGKSERVVVLMNTDIYGTTESLEFLAGSKKCKNNLKKLMNRWGFDCFGPPRSYTYRTVFFGKRYR